MKRSSHITTLLQIAALALLLGAVAGDQLKPGDTFRDCEDCPVMVVVPAGSFMMGSPDSEEGRYDNEGPVHEVTISKPFAVGVYEVTFDEWDACVSAGGCSGYRPHDGIYDDDSGYTGDSWGRGSRPVINVSWGDAQRYARWLSQKTGKTYRLLSESKWEYAARAGTWTVRYWGESESGQCRHANGADESAKREDSGLLAASCDDGYVHTAPVSSFSANAFGLYDVLGNVYEWVGDCWNNNYEGAPTDGGMWEAGDCDRAVLRGGSWSSNPRFLRSAYRHGVSTGYRDDIVGFRIARTIGL